MKNALDFRADCIALTGKTYPARYEVSADKVRVITSAVMDGKLQPVGIEIPADDPYYSAALAAAKGEAAPQVEEERAETIPADEAAAAPVEAQAQEGEAQQGEGEPAETISAEEAAPQPEAAAEAPAEPVEAQAQEEAPQEGEAQQIEEEPAETIPADEETAAPADDPKPARPVPEKSFIGESISGKGWSIVFDGGCNRTRVIVTAALKDKARPVIENAGFYYSPTLDSWNKKLTFKAYRAAQALAQSLTAALA